MHIDSLSELYQSLNKQEKRWISVELKKSGGESDFIPSRLFSLLVQGGSVEKARAGFKGTRQESQFAVLKAQLYRRILYQLLIYSRSTIPDRRLTDELATLQVLFSKKLYRQCERIYERVRSQTEYVHRPALLAELEGWGMRLLHVRQDVRGLAKQAGAVYRNQEMHLKAQAQIYLLQNLTYEAFVELKSDWFTTERKKSRTEQQLKRIRETDLSSGHARVLYYQVWATLLFSTKRPAKALTYLEKQIRLLQNNIQMLEVFEQHYISALNNANMIYLQARRYEPILENIRLLRNIRPRTVSRRQQLLERLLTIEMNVYLETGDYAAAGKLAAEMESVLSNHRADPVYRKLFLLLIFRYEFERRQFRAALRTLSNFRKEEKSQVRPDIHRTVSILEMIVHSETGHSDFVFTLAKRISRRKENKPDRVQRIFIAFLEEIQSVAQKKARALLFRKLEADLLSKETESLFRANYQNNFDFLRWIRENNRT